MWRYISSFLRVFIFCIFLSSVHARDHVITVSAEQFPNLLNSPVQDIAVYRLQKWTWEAIPFQIDEKMDNQKQGRYEYVLASGGNGVFDGQDELSLMSGDLGGRAQAAPFAVAYELEISGRCAYVGRDPQKKLPAASRSYVTYDPGEDRVSTARYQTAFLPTTPLVQHELLLRNGVVISNILDRLKMRFFLDLRLFFNMKISEETITSKVVGYTLGPIRLIRRVVLYQKIGPIRVTPKAVSDFIFSHDQIHISTMVDAPFDPKVHLNQGSVALGGFDFTHPIYGSAVHSEHNPKSVRIDGVMSEDEQQLRREGVHWWVLSGNAGHMIGAVTLDEQLRGLSLNLYYQDDALRALPPEREVGQSMLGFSIDPSALPQGRFQLWMDQYFPPHSFRPGGEGAYLDSQVSVSIHEK